MFKRLLCCLTLLAAMVAVFEPADAQVQPTIRVCLKRLKVEDALRIQVSGTYMLEDGSMLFSDGTDMTVALSEDQLVLHHGSMAIVMGSTMTLRRCDSEKPCYLLLQSESGMYEGDLRLDIADGTIRPVLSINVEDYLLGVVPFEMGDSFPLEALKAQAIAARTYALRKSGSGDAYDVEDTTNDQAYKGRTTYSPLSEQAVRETAGLCGMYKGKLAQCYYSASNGGQTELGQNVWPTDQPDEYGYMDMRDDPYDLANEASVVKRFTLPKKPGEDGISPALHSALVDALSNELQALGYSAEDDLVRFDQFKLVQAEAQKYGGDSRLMTQMRFDVRISVRDAVFRDITPSPIATPVYSAAPDATPTPQPTPSPTPRPTATPAYSPYKKLDQTFTVTLPYFNAAERAMGLSINVSQNELVTVLDIGSSYMIESRRFGHGVGMSQRGAQQMAAYHGMTYDQILAFYYPGMQIAQQDTVQAPLPGVNMELMATPAPTPSPTPRPTLMPVTADKLPKGAYLAVVENINDDSSLNLRETPSLSGEIKRRLYKNQQLIVLSVSRDGWAHVKTDVVEGYVKAEYLQAVQKR